MFYEIAQSALTAAAEVIAIAGITGIVAHALYTQHKNFMTEFCPPVAPYQPEVQAAVAPAVVEAVEVATAEQPEIQEEEVETAVAPAASEQPETEIDLTALDPTTLRKLCTKHQIAWKHARGKNRHATKSMMIHQLSSRLTA
jgi:hypothetical protein